MTTTQPGRDAVEVRHDGAVATLVMRGSAAGNALGGLLWQQLPEVLDALAVDDNVGAVILSCMRTRPGRPRGQRCSGRNGSCRTLSSPLPRARGRSSR